MPDPSKRMAASMSCSLMVVILGPSGLWGKMPPCSAARFPLRTDPIVQTIAYAPIAATHVPFLDVRPAWRVPGAPAGHRGAVGRGRRRAVLAGGGDSGHRRVAAGDAVPVAP